MRNESLPIDLEKISNETRALLKEAGFNIIDRKQQRSLLMLPENDDIKMVADPIYSDITLYQVYWGEFLIIRCSAKKTWYADTVEFQFNERQFKNAQKTDPAQFTFNSYERAKREAEENAKKIEAEKQDGSADKKRATSDFFYAHNVILGMAQDLGRDATAKYAASSPQTTPSSSELSKGTEDMFRGMFASAAKPQSNNEAKEEPNFCGMKKGFLK